MQRHHEAFFETLDWDGCNIKDMPHVRKSDSGRHRVLDEMLDELDRRLYKNGRLDQYRDNQEFTKPSKERRDARQAQKYRAETGKSHRWRGGVER